MLDTDLFIIKIFIVSLIFMWILTILLFRKKLKILNTKIEYILDSFDRLIHNHVDIFKKDR
jgi:diacylglycerol kinase